MSAALIWNNVAAYSLQVGVVIAVAGCIPTLLRLRRPKARLWFWHCCLAACLLLPLVRPWRSQSVSLNVQVSTAPFTVALAPLAPAPKRIPFTEIALFVLAAGVAARLIFLAAGFERLLRYRRNSTPADPATQTYGVQVRLSQDVTGPVTFGVFRPVILLPDSFPELSASARDAILFHELLHVHRMDWLFTVAEELVRAALWFHPAIWWLLGEIQLTREQVVDREVIQSTQSHETYVDALLAAAGAPSAFDLAAAPSFLRKRHLKHRVVSILKEARMPEVRISKTRLFSTLALAASLLAGASWLATGAFPLSAQPQTVTVRDADGIAVDTYGAPLMHRTPVPYPAGALASHIEGAVMAQVKLSQTGEVSDAVIISGPDELRNTVLGSILRWHFSPDLAGTTRQIAITFKTPQGVAGGIRGGASQGVTGGVAGGVVQGVPQGISAPAPGLAGILGAVSSSTPGRGVSTGQASQSVPGVVGSQTHVEFADTLASMGPVRSFRIYGLNLSESEQSALIAKLPVHVNDKLTPELVTALRAAVAQIDDHLFVTFSMQPGRDTIVLIALRPLQQEAAFATTSQPEANIQRAPTGPVAVGGRVQAAKLLYHPDPIYPQDAKEARIQGKVILAATIGPDGHMQELSVVSGHEMLQRAALDAVRRWVYQPTTLNQFPVAVSTTIEVNFTLSQ